MAPDSNTVDISKSLKEYLKRNENGSSEEKSNLLRSWSFDSWFSKSTTSLNNEEESAWFSRAEKDSYCASLSKKQRIVGFMGCVLMGFFCFTLAGLYVPVLLLKARKFCLLYSMGSLFIIGSFSFLWGPCSHIKHLCSYERLPFTSIYFGTMFLTLYSALWMKNTIITAIFAIAQVVALLWYVISYIPGGQTGLKFFTRICTSTVTRTSSRMLPV
ncbi:Protein transport protein SFT2 [Araneus ventricosus]|uniref:Vesicle transport protein n=1 Tax=Araneus ventricosus TaxID=182803 RepID=A0A4Y2PXM3_ARAVE|nr:Protein transport protein SFT2 [Araneus ventricosus]